ncbi:MAG: glycosyltransferase [Bacilli bacterium]|nr:glycosyltransferase [Bacilli bacterium]
MKVLLYTEGLKKIGKSGLGKAVKHQIRALEDNGIEYSLDPKDIKSCDIVHINFYGLKSYMLAKRAHRLGKKVVYHAHSTEEDFKNSFIFSNKVSKIFKWWISKCYKLGDVIITPTEYSKRLLLNYNLNRDIYAISNGLDTRFFECDTVWGREFRKYYHYNENDKVIMGVGLYLKRKGILDFVELAKRMPEYKFIWFGYLDLKYVPKEIKDAVNTKLPNLKFAGYVEPIFLRKAYSGANLYLFPTLEETEGIPILEAMCECIPTLVRDIPVFEEYKNNIDVYKAKDIDDFEARIKDILEGRLPSLKENGYKCAKAKDVKIVGKQLIDVYEKVLKG